MRCFPWSLRHLKTWCRVWLFGKDEERGLVGGRCVTGVGLGFQTPYAIPSVLSLLVVCGLGCELSDAAQHHACLLPCILLWQWCTPIPWTICPKWTLPSLSCLAVLSQQQKVVQKVRVAERVLKWKDPWSTRREYRVEEQWVLWETHGVYECQEGEFTQSCGQRIDWHRIRFQKWKIPVSIKGWGPISLMYIFANKLGLCTY